MIEENINTLKKLNIAEYNINDLEKIIDNVKNGKEVDYSRGFYMGYVFGLYDTCLISSVDMVSLVSEVEEP